MSGEKELKQAQAVYKALCNMLDDHNWNYEKNEKELSIYSGARGDDLPIELRIRVDAQRKLVSLLSQMPFDVPENRRTALAVAVSEANSTMVDGDFDYNYLTGKIIFRMTTSFLDSLIGKELFEYMLSCACYTIDEYNDKFLMVAMKDMSVDQILKFIKGDR